MKMVNHTFDSNYDANDTVADHLRLYGDCISSVCRAKETPDDLREFEDDESSYIWYFLAGLLLKLIQYDPLMMQQKEARRKHPCVLPKKVAFLV